MNLKDNIILATKIIPKINYEAMGEGGRVTLGAQMENGDLVLTVADTGAGMTREPLENLF